jgi:hypothetical protein
MDKSKLILNLLLLLGGFALKGHCSMIGVSNPNYFDGIDKRVLLARAYLNKKLNKREVENLWFTAAVAHVKDATDFFVKIPYKDKSFGGFMLVKKNKFGFQYAKIKIEGYAYDARRLRDKDLINVIIVSSDKRLNKKFYMHKSGWVQKMYYPKPRKYLRDTGFSITPFLGYANMGSENNDSAGISVSFEQFEAYLNTNFVFDVIDSLNHQKLHAKVLVQDMIPLGFVQKPSFELEYLNSDILPGIDIKQMFKRFDNKPDSLKQQ